MTKRLRVFAGPNGSGKSTIIDKILKTEIKAGVNLDFGVYINADDIAKTLHLKSLDFNDYQVCFEPNEFFEIISNSGLINNEFSMQRFKACTKIRNSKISLNRNNLSSSNDAPDERIAQILADYLRKKLLKEEKKFSFETVFSHPGKVDIIKEAKSLGYKVYLYFVSTEHPKINVYRVKVVRVKKKGHDVPEEKIISRYYRSMDLLHEAAQSCYQAYFFDNSIQGGKHTMFAHFKLNSEGTKVWDEIDDIKYPNWFKKYYSDKITPH